MENLSVRYVALMFFALLAAALVNGAGSRANPKDIPPYMPAAGFGVSGAAYEAAYVDGVLDTLAHLHAGRDIPASFLQCIFEDNDPSFNEAVFITPAGKIADQWFDQGTQPTSIATHLIEQLSQECATGWIIIRYGLDNQ